MRGRLLLAAALAVFVLTQLPLDPHTTIYSSLAPWPDAAEYVDGAVHLADTGRFAIHVAGREMPPRYPPGYSFLLAGLIKAGFEPLTAPLWLNRAFALVILLGLYLAFARAGYPLAGGLAALLMATRTSFVVLTRSPMSEVAAAAFMLGCVWALHRHWGRPKVSLVALGGLALGLSATLRLLHVLFAGLLGLAAFRAGRLHWKDGAAAVAAFLLGLSPVLLYNTATFGSPLETGYSFWIEDVDRGKSGFAFANIPERMADFADELTQSEAGPTTAHLYGAGSYLAPMLVGAILLSLWKLRDDRFVRLTAAAAAAYFAAWFSYYYPEFRLCFPVIVLSVPFVAFAAVRCWNEHEGLLGRSALGLGLALLLAGLPGARSTFDLGDMIRTPSLYMIPAPEFATVEFLNSLKPVDSLVLTDMAPPYVHALTSRARIVAPLLDNHDYSHHPENFKFGERERRALINAAQARGASIYAVSARFPLEGLEARWNILWRNELGGGVAVLGEH